MPEGTFLPPGVAKAGTSLSDASPSTQAHGDSAAAGSGTLASRADHKHAMPAAGGPSQANQAAIEGETNEDTYVPPDLVKNSPGVAKGYCRITAAGALVAGSYNVSSITDTGTGDRTINWNTDFGNANYSCVSTFSEMMLDRHIQHDVFTAGSVDMEIRSDSGSNYDVATSTVAFGDQ